MNALSCLVRHDPFIIVAAVIVTFILVAGAFVAGVNYQESD
jgi:uncharacterized protein involved in exopolysaccharide biosynthesis